MESGTGTEDCPRCTTAWPVGIPYSAIPTGTARPQHAVVSTPLFVSRDAGRGSCSVASGDFHIEQVGAMTMFEKRAAVASEVTRSTPEFRCFGPFGCVEPMP
jgi:hypothetical protein